MTDVARDRLDPVSQSRLAGLLRANRLIAADLELPVVLRRIVEAACELVNAPYGALGVISPTGGLEQFIHVGMDADTVQRIGRLPEGKGLLGALTDDAHPIRLQRMADDPRSAGLPQHHPPMTSFLGVPIRVRGEVYGNLYLTGNDETYVSAEDEELVFSLAASAGVAIENARLFTEARARQDWLRASTEITRQLLSDVGEEPLRVIARRLQQIADADAVNVVLPTADDRRLMVEVATGAGAADITAMTYPIEDTVSQRVLEAGLPVLIGDIAQGDQGTVHLSDIVPVGPIMVLPLVGAQRIRGALIVARLRGREQFSAGDLDMATTFANHAALALELADARADQARVLLLEDHDRIARDLHDHVIQRLFGAGLTIQSVASVLDSPAEISRLSDVVDDLDETIRQIRTSIFRLRGPLGPVMVSVRARLLEVVAELVPHLGFQPRVSFIGPVDTLVDASIVPDVLAVLREGLTNAARHAGASWISVEVIAEPHELSVELTDDGVGIGDSGRRSGLANLTERAESYGGQLTLRSPTMVPAQITLPDQRGTQPEMDDSTGQIRVFLLDDHEIVRRGISDLLGAEADITVVGEAASIAEAMARIPAVRPDVAVLDARLPDGSGIDVCRDVRSSMPSTACLILTSYDDDDALFAAVMAGAAGYLLKEVRGSSIVEAIRQVAAGKSLLDPVVTGRLLARLRDGAGASEDGASRGGAPRDARMASLTDREREVLALIADGMTNKQIGERLFLAEKTVKNYVSGLLSKLGMQRRTQAAVYGAQARNP